MNNLFTVKDTPKSPSQQGTSANITPPKEETEDKKSKVTPQQPSTRNIGMPEKAKKMNFVNMDLPDDNRMGQIPQLQTTATDVTVISPVNPSNPFMTITSGFYGIHM